MDMDSDDAEARPRPTQFTTMTIRAKSRVAPREKVNWLEEQYVNNVFTVDAAYTSRSNDGLGRHRRVAPPIKPNDILRNMTHGRGVPRHTADRQRTATSTSSPPSATPSPRRPQARRRQAAVRRLRVPAGCGAAGHEVLAARPGLQLHPDLPHGLDLRGDDRPPSSCTADASLRRKAARKTVEHKRELEHNGFFGARDWYHDRHRPRRARPVA